MLALFNPDRYDGAGSGYKGHLDCRTRMLLCVSAAVATLVFSNPLSQCAIFGASFAYLMISRHIRATLFAYAFMAVMACLAVAWTGLIGLLVPGMMRNVQIWSLWIPFLRCLTMMNVLLPLAFCTRIQQVLGALEGMRLPFVIYLPCAVMIRFIPSFASDTRQVWESLKIRGWNVGFWHCAVHPVEITRLLFAPLLFRTLKTSDDLGIAAELKGLGRGRRLVPYDAPQFGWADAAAMALAAVVIASAIALSVVCPIDIKPLHG